MKKTKLAGTAHKICLLLTIAAITFVSSCGKGDGSYSNIAALTVIHASPGLNPIDFYINGNRLNNADSALMYTDTISYKLLNSGTVGITVKKYISSITYISQNIDIQPDRYYSFFITGKPDSVNWVFTQDYFTAPATGKAKLRFLHLSPDSPPFDLKLSSANTLFTGKAYKSYTDFASVDPGIYTLGLFEQGNSLPLAEKVLEVEEGRFYSVWATGLKISSDPALALAIQSISVK